MDRPFPSPLQVASPVIDRKGSRDPVPDPLRVGSPVVNSGSAFSPRRASRPTSTSSDRLSQLFPDRPSPTIASGSRNRTDSQKRLSYPSPLVPAAESAYRVPRAPAPPTFFEDTSYDPAPDTFETHLPTFPKPDRTRSLLSRLTSLRTARSKHSRYGVLEDVDEGDVSSGRLRGLEEELEDFETNGQDLSALSGSPIFMRKISGKRNAPARTESIDSEQALAQAEYERLESGWKPGVLGRGMMTVVESPFVYESAPVRSATYRRGLPTVDREEIRKVAEEKGEIVAVSEFPVDISNLSGAEYDSRSVLTAASVGAEGDAKKSYYFPPDPDMPSWRPLSMHPIYISMLISIALALAAIQEWLCQRSIKLTREDNGLLRFKRPQDLSVLQYFTWKYAPTMILVSYGILWQIADFEVKRLEPYYQLSKKTGATAAESLNIDYLTFLSYLTPLKALRYKQWAVVYSSLGTLAASGLVPVLQSASIFMYPDQQARRDNDWKYVRVDPPWSRAVTASLIFVAACGIVLLFQLRRKSGLLSDPKGIAGIAAMATRSHILNDFRGLDVAPQHVIHKQLRHRRYILHKSSLWQGEYIRNSNGDGRFREEEGKSTDSRPLMLTLVAGVPYICFIVCFASLIPVFLFVPGANRVTEKLPFLLTALATAVKLLWNTLDCDVRLTEPFYILWRRHAPPRTLTLDYTGTVPGYLVLKAALNRHYVVALVGLGAIMTEVLTVCVSSFSVDGQKFVAGNGGVAPSSSASSSGGGAPDQDQGQNTDRYNTDETFKSFWVSFALTIGILISLALIAALVYARRSHRFMPRQVGTVASVLGFVHQSKMLVGFVGTERLDSARMTRFLERRGGTYALGWFPGRDGEDHCGIDEEPVLAAYRYGVDWTKTRLVGSNIGTWEHY